MSKAKAPPIPPPHQRHTIKHRSGAGRFKSPPASRPDRKLRPASGAPDNPNPDGSNMNDLDTGTPAVFQDEFDGAELDE